MRVRLRTSVGVSVRFGRGGGRPFAEHAKKEHLEMTVFGPHVLFKVFDQSALSTEAKDETSKRYPNARRAHLRTGGNFPYLCGSGELNLSLRPCPGRSDAASRSTLNTHTQSAWKQKGFLCISRSSSERTTEFSVGMTHRLDTLVHISNFLPGEFKHTRAT